MDKQMDLERWLSLIHCCGRSLRELNRRVQIRHPGKTLTELDAEELSGFLGDLVDALPNLDGRGPERDLQWLEGGADRHLLPLTDERFPWLLRQIPDSPLVLFVSGNLQSLDLPCLSIVGSRNPTPIGRETAVYFAKGLAEMGFAVASGLAQGIDGSAHRGALETGSTIAVCAHGLDTVYPAIHRRLADQIRETGALVSEYPPGTPPRRNHFPQRNRLISGLSLGTVVVEAGLRSGSLITARLAVEQNREVYSVPGPISSPLSKGCHELIRDGATLVESLADILRELDQYRHVSTPSDFPETNDNNGHAWFLDHMGYAPCTRDDLVRRSGLTSGEVSSMLLVLELEGCVEMCPGGTYVRVTKS